MFGKGQESDCGCQLHDALCMYKSTTFDIGRPIEVELIISEAVDLGGPRRHSL